ncbi:hypothetical protein POSPLADRAFT_1046733 [Postia placenta MAD-698-R-SB12]|uniref:Uncharacterized protein n=1 Tax=Postia placenta MAD-698-R-SB12 TaxID=670580 RepID=A0A1X6N1A5_9APHY|nr:hypothetical protein POSPLADRAFT_1046733 [Postia placenta MAD-698-R-SB12]OSX62398.1 hypothetical protein POSPLADRAFT_1046733 [Postia placenta MAD-698-R-SB12]
MAKAQDAALVHQVLIVVYEFDKHYILGELSMPHQDANRVSGQFRRSPWTLERWSIAHGLRIKEILATAVELCSKTTMTMTGTPTTSYMMSLSKDEANAASPSSSVRALTSSSSNCVAVHAPRHRCSIFVLHGGVSGRAQISLSNERRRTPRIGARREPEQPLARGTAAKLSRGSLRASWNADRSTPRFTEHREIRLQLLAEFVRDTIMKRRKDAALGHGQPEEIMASQNEEAEHVKTEAALEIHHQMSNE